MGKTIPLSVFSCRLDKYCNGSRFKAGDVQICLAFNVQQHRFLLYGIQNMEVAGKKQVLYFTIPQDRIWNILKRRNKLNNIDEFRTGKIKNFKGNWDRVTEIIVDLEKQGKISRTKWKPK